jgi:hypothetical protein
MFQKTSLKRDRPNPYCPNLNFINLSLDKNGFARSDIGEILRRRGEGD